jgi:hypothetical protein
VAIAFWAQNSMGFEGELYASNPWDTVTLGGKQLPGLCEVRGLPRLQLDRQKVNGQDGATLIERGYLPGPIEIKVTIWTPEQWEVMQDVISAIWRKPGKIATTQKKVSQSQIKKEAKVAEQAALDIDYPGAAMLRIKSVVVDGLSMPEPGSGEQVRVISIKCVEYVPTQPTVATKKVKGAARVTVVKELRRPEKNNPRNPPSKTDGGPGGPPKAVASGPF